MRICVALITLLAMVEFFFAIAISYRRTKQVHYAIKFGALYVFDSWCGFVPKKNLHLSRPWRKPNVPRFYANFDVRTDEFCFYRDRGELANHHGRLIFCLGGSTTVGAESPFEKNYPNQLESMLPKDIMVVNAGTGAYRSVHERLRLERDILPWSPHVVVLFSGFNDFEHALAGYSENDRANPFHHCFMPYIPPNRVVSFFEFSASFFYLNKVLRIGRLKDIRNTTIDDNKVFFGWQQCWLSNIRSIHKMCTERGCRLLLVNHFSPCFVGAGEDAIQFSENELAIPRNQYKYYANFMVSANQLLADYCRDTDACLVDAASSFDKSSRRPDGSVDAVLRCSYFVDRVHLTPEANAIVASAAYQTIQLCGLL